MKTQNPSVLGQIFEKFTVPCLLDFVEGDQDEMLLCRVSALKYRYLSRTEQYHPACRNLFIATTKRKKSVY